MPGSSSSSFFGNDNSGHWLHGGAVGADSWPAYAQSSQNFLATESQWDGGDHSDWQEFYFDAAGHYVCGTCSQYWYDSEDDYNDTDTEDQMLDKTSMTK